MVMDGLSRCDKAVPWQPTFYRRIYRKKKPSYLSIRAPLFDTGDASIWIYLSHERGYVRREVRPIFEGDCARCLELTLSSHGTFMFSFSVTQSAVFADLYTFHNNMSGLLYKMP